MWRTTKKFVSIELHPAVYVSFIAANLCLVFVYREVTGQMASPEAAPHEAIKEVKTEAVVSHPIVKPTLAMLPTAFHRPFQANVDATGDVSEYSNDPPTSDLPKPVSRVKSPEREKPPLMNGAAIAAVSVKENENETYRVKPKSRKKVRSYSSGLVPPPPPGVDIVPPPPDAPSLFAGGKFDMSKYSSMLVEAPPPMVLGQFASDFSYEAMTSSSRQTSRSKSRDYGLPKNGERSKTVRHGRYKQVIVSR